MITALLIDYPIAETRNHSRILHGLSSHELYKPWKRMIARCYINSPNSNYKYYGARGIRVAERWMDFRNFVLDMEPTFNKNLTLDRINSEKHYTPDNCRWATIETQSINKRNVRFIKVNGELQAISNIARSVNIHPETIANRLKSGMSVDDAINKKAKSNPKPKPVIVDGIIYPSLTNAAKCIGVTKSAIFNRLKHNSARYV